MYSGEGLLMCVAVGCAIICVISSLVFLLGVIVILCSVLISLLTGQMGDMNMGMVVLINTSISGLVAAVTGFIIHKIMG